MFVGIVYTFCILDINATTFNENDINISTSQSSNKIHFLPVLGDAILLESNGQYALIDGGEDNDNPRELPDLNIAGYEDFVVDYIKQIAGDKDGKVRLEFIIGTHAHSDHLGGLDTVVSDPDIYVKKGYLKYYNEEMIDEYEVENWDNKEVFLQLVEALESEGSEIIYELTDEIFHLGDMDLQLYNIEDHSKYPNHKKGENENSLGVKVTVNNKSIF